MSKKHNIKHERSQSAYGPKLREGRCDGRQSDPKLSDGKRATEHRS